MRWPDKKNIFENFFKLVIFNIILAIAWKSEKPRFYLVYLIMNVTAVLLFAMIDSSIDDDELVEFRRKRTFEEIVRKKRGYHSLGQKIIFFFFTDPPKFMVYSYIIIFCIIFFIFKIRRSCDRYIFFMGYGYFINRR